MSRTDPMAAERLRTILYDTHGYMHDNPTTCLAVNDTLDVLKEPRFERSLSPAGVPVRRVVVATAWETDPEPLHPNHVRNARRTLENTTGDLMGDSLEQVLTEPDALLSVYRAAMQRAGEDERVAQAIRNARGVLYAYQATLTPETAALARQEIEVAAARVKTGNPQRDDLIRRFLSVLDGTSLTERIEVAEALADSAHRALGAEVRRRLTWPDVEAYIKRMRDRHADPSNAQYGQPAAWHWGDEILDDFREHMHTGTPLGVEVQGPIPDIGTLTPEQITEARVRVEAEAGGVHVQPHAFVGTRYKGQDLEGCSHFTRTSSHEGIMCGARADNQIHVVDPS